MAVIRNFYLAFVLMEIIKEVLELGMINFVQVDNKVCIFFLFFNIYKHDDVAKI
jgi:hypothetical protein